jgi:mevalonate kinase
MIAGEYSVLLTDGWSLSVTCDAGIVAHAVPAPKWSVCRADLSMTWCPGEEVPEPLRFAAAAIEVLQQEGLPPCALETRLHSPPAIAGSKVGIGGSASSTVSLIAAALGSAQGLTERENGLDPDEVASLALVAHQRAQDGRGSGYDVASVAHGGVLAWNASRREAKPLSWPDELHAQLVYTGMSASTTALLGRWERAVLPATREETMRDLRESTDAVIASFQTLHVPDILEALRHTQGALLAFDDAHDLAIVPGDVRALCDAVHEQGAVARVSGGGGGDSLLVFADTAMRLERALRAAEAAGGTALTLNLPAPGVRLIRANGLAAPLQ